MRLTPLLAALTLAACATTPDLLPRLHYADAASRGSLASFFAGRPTASQVDEATQTWSHALGDSFACGVPMDHIVNAGLAGALEIGAMNAAASRGGEREIRSGVSRYVGELVRLAFDRRQRPDARRCDTLLAWAPRTAADGREAVARARENGLIDDYPMLDALIR